jgi:glutamate-1-semialdehyde 2,1-aminomutase
VQRAQGARIWDADGKEYIDYVARGVRWCSDTRILTWWPRSSAQAEHGLSFGAPTEAEYEIAALLCKTLPSLEMVRLVSSGTEATMTAIRLARGSPVATRS